MRQAKIIKDPKDIAYLTSLKSKDIDMNCIMKNFGSFGDKPPKFEPYDIITFPPNSVIINNNTDKKNKKAFTTTVGIFIFNKLFIEEELSCIFGYINKIVDDGVFGDINSKISYALAEDLIPLSVHKKYLLKTQVFMPFVSILSPSASIKMETSTPIINKKKQELIKKYKKELSEGNEVVAEKVEKEALGFAKEYLKGDPAMDVYLSGARGSIGNNFKNMYVMKGAIKDPDPDKGYDIATSNYMDGVSKEEYSVFAKSLVAGPYARGKKTEVGGYWEKLFVSAFQHVVIGKVGSNCGTKRVLKIDKLDKATAKGMMYSYMVEGSKLVELTSQNMNKYIGKPVKFRFASLCESKDNICQVCAGNGFNRLGIDNIGVASASIPSTLKLASMKAFHDSTVQTIEMDPMKAFSIM